MTDILYFEYLLMDVDLARKFRERTLSQAEIGNAADENLDWKEDFAFEQAQRDFMVAGQKVAEQRAKRDKYENVIKPKKEIPNIQKVEIGASVLLDIENEMERYLIAATSDIDGGSRYQGRISTETPLAKELMGRSPGYRFSFRGFDHSIEEIEWGVPSYLEDYLARYFGRLLDEFGRRIGEDLKEGEITRDSVKLMNVADGFLFTRMVNEAYPLLVSSLPGSPQDYEKEIRGRLNWAKQPYKPFPIMIEDLLS